MKTRDMPVSYQDYVLYSQATGAPLPRNPQERMQMAPQVYDFTRQIGTRPSNLQQGLRAVGRGLAVLGGAGVAVGVANSLFNKPSDNYRQAVTDNQTTFGKDARSTTQTTYDEANTTVAEDLSGENNQYSSNIGPHSLEELKGGLKRELKEQHGIKSRMSTLSGQEFGPALRYGDPAANIAAVKLENEAVLRGEAPKTVTGTYGPQELMGQGGMSISTGEEEDYRRKTGQSLKKYGLTERTKPERRGQFRTDLILDKKGLQDKAQREQSEYAASPRYQEEQFRERMSRDTYIPPSNDPPTPAEEFLSQKITQLENPESKKLPEKKTPEISNIGESKQTEEPKDRSPRGVIPPDKSGTMNKTDLGAIGDIIGTKQSDNPIVGGIQGIVKVAQVMDKLGRRAAEEIVEKGNKDRRNYAKYEETVRKAKAFKDIAEDRESTEDPK